MKKTAEQIREAVALSNNSYLISMLLQLSDPDLCDLRDIMRDEEVWSFEWHDGSRWRKIPVNFPTYVEASLESKSFDKEIPTRSRRVY